MDFLNRTPHAAHLFRSELKPDVMYNAVVARLRHRLDGGALILQPGGAAIRFEPEEDDRGHTLEADEIYGRTGTDLILLADAMAPEPVTRMSVTVEAGPYRQELSVTGHRQWQAREPGSVEEGEGKEVELVPSEPAPFTSMPLTYAGAFGGAAVTPLGDVSSVNNPMGKGFYLHADQALGQPLPNLEDPAAPVSAWDDQPEPVGLAPYPSTWGLRIARTTELDEERQRATFHPERGFFDRGHPRLCGQRLEAGQRVRLGGVAAAGEVTFELPACPLEVEVTLGPSVQVRAPILEEVLVDLHAGYVDLTYRKLFHYAFVPRQLRRTVLRSRAT